MKLIHSYFNFYTLAMVLLHLDNRIKVVTKIIFHNRLKANKIKCAFCIVINQTIQNTKCAFCIVWYVILLKNRDEMTYFQCFYCFCIIYFIFGKYRQGAYIR